MTELLRTEAATKAFGGLVAVNQVDMHLNEGEILGLIGPNGAGKTTLFNLITGLYHPVTSGEIYFQGKRITHLSQPEIVGLGMCRTFQILRIFRFMSVIDNVLVGLHTRSKGSVVDALLNLPAAWAEERRARERAMHYLELLGLKDHWNKPAKGLTYGDQRRVEVARALAAEPDLLLLDEPAAGLDSVGGACPDGVDRVDPYRPEEDHPADRTQHAGRDADSRQDRGPQSGQEDL